MERQQRIYLGKKGYEYLRSIGVTVNQIREMKKLDHGLPIRLYNGELIRLPISTPAPKQLSARG